MKKFFAILHVWLYRATGGRLGNWDWGAGGLLVLTTKGRKSGKMRATPLGYLREEGYYVVVASNYGAAKPPSWYLNLKASQMADVQVGAERMVVRVEELSGMPYQSVWSKLVKAAPRYARYQAMVERQIPLVALHPQ